MRKITSNICAGREEASLSGQDREYGLRVLIEFSQSRNGFAQKITAECIERFGSIELSSLIREDVRV